ncbi:MAG: hypothetical protein KAU10_01155, partial [Dehalococcoidia bacterium]|nr:hypothetical protein [Dehalococcoidia bacterium]
MTQDPAKRLDINAIEGTLDELLERYRQALRAVELLPAWGRVPDSEHLVEITPPVDQRRSQVSRVRTYLLQVRTRHADWVRSRFAVRRLARMFLRSHIQSKLRAIAERLEVERFASGHMDADTSRQLDDIIAKLRAYDECLTQRGALWLKVPGCIWVVVAPVLITYLKGTPGVTVTTAVVLAHIAIYVLYFALFFWAPLFTFGALGGFHWKRLILVGQTGDMNTNIATNVIVRWGQAPQASTYQSENRLFGALGLPKPNEFPWDLVLAPVTLMLTALALAFFLLALAFVVSVTELGWPVLIAVVLFIASFFCLRSVQHAILRTLRQ